MDKTAKTESGKNVAEIATQKATGDNKEKIQEKPSKVLDWIGAHVPDEVWQAWTEAEKEMGGWLGSARDRK